MKYAELEKPWQRVFELCWEAFREGNLPIAAVITDADGNIISVGRNHYVMSKRFPNCKVDHAETECIQSLDINKYPDTKNYTIYTSTEPCPMCIGTIIMSNITNIVIGARDAWAGASDICDKSAYAQRKQTKITFADDVIAQIQIAVQGYSELLVSGTQSLVYQSFVSSYQLGASVAMELFGKRKLEKFVREGKGVEEVFDLIAAMVEG